MRCGVVMCVSVLGRTCQCDVACINPAVPRGLNRVQLEAAPAHVDAAASRGGSCRCMRIMVALPARCRGAAIVYIALQATRGRVFCTPHSPRTCCRKLRCSTICGTRNSHCDATSEEISGDLLGLGRPSSSSCVVSAAVAAAAARLSESARATTCVDARMVVCFGSERAARRQLPLFQMFKMSTWISHQRFVCGLREHHADGELSCQFWGIMVMVAAVHARALIPQKCCHSMWCACLHSVPCSNQW